DKVAGKHRYWRIGSFRLAFTASLFVRDLVTPDEANAQLDQRREFAFLDLHPPQVFQITPIVPFIIPQILILLKKSDLIIWIVRCRRKMNKNNFYTLGKLLTIHFSDSK